MNEHTYVMDKIRQLTVENKLLVERIVELEKENASLDAQNKRVCSEIAELEKELSLETERLKTHKALKRLARDERDIGIKRIAELEKELKTPSKQGLLEVLELNDRHLGRIAELGKERNELKCKLSHSETMGELEQAKRDLEQQAKGVNDFGKWVLDTDKNASGLDVRDIALIEFYVEPLISQAKALKEQVK